MCAEPSRSTTVSNLRLKKAKHYGQNFPKSFRPFSAGTEEPFTIQSHKLHGRTFIVTVVMVATCLLYLLARIGSIFPNVNGCTHVTCMSHVQIHTHTHTHTLHSGCTTPTGHGAPPLPTHSKVVCIFSPDKSCSPLAKSFHSSSS